MSPLSTRSVRIALILLLTQTSVGHCQTLPTPQPVKKVEAANRSILTYKDVARALLTIKDYQPYDKTGTIKSSTRGEVTAAIMLLGFVSSPQAISTLAENIDFHLGPSIRRDILAVHPALGALKKIGLSSVPLIYNGIAASTDSERSLGMTPVALKLALDNMDDGYLTSTTSSYALDYRRRARSLRVLSKQLPELVTGTPSIKQSEVELLLQKSDAHIPLPSEAQRIWYGGPTEVDLVRALSTIQITDERTPRLARILELQDIVLDESPEASEARSIAAITELGKLRAVETAPALADKLDWEVGPGFPEDKQIPSINAARIKGKVSTAITEAAKVALEQIGAEALPAVMDASTMQYRLPRFRENALQLVVKITGGKEQAQSALEAAAQEDEAKQQRLLDWLKKVNVPTPIQ